MILLYAKNKLIIKAVIEIFKISGVQQENLFCFENRLSFVTCAKIFVDSILIIDSSTFSDLEDSKWLSLKLNDIRGMKDVFFIMQRKSIFPFMRDVNFISEVMHLKELFDKSIRGKLNIEANASGNSILKIAILNRLDETLCKKHFELIRCEAAGMHGRVLYKKTYGLKSYQNRKGLIQKKLNLENRYEYENLIANLLRQ